MKTLYTDMNIRVNVGNATLLVLNIIFEKFQRTIAKHSHGQGSYELHYIPRGYGTVFIDGKAYKIVPNIVYMTGPYVEHEQISSKKESMEEYCVYFKLQNMESDKLHQESVINKFIQTHFWFGQDTQDLHSIMKRIFFELEHKYEGYIVMVESLLQQCIVSAVRNYEGMNHSKTHFSTTNLSDSKSIIVEESFLYDYETLTLKRLSERLGLSTRQTQRFLKNNYGKNFTEKIKDAKMAAAKTLLSDRSISISEIAERLNYSSIQHFSYTFKRYYGITATSFRNNTFNIKDHSAVGTQLSGF